ncbi:MAG: hypothetical protein BBJ57_07405 [Desulfobacterales bacterium PC51MH44]|nr:MAG: hypothetical protein BBJ57_07405 [Desulfobacterales bacterium PC51MH44]
MLTVQQTIDFWREKAGWTRKKKEANRKKRILISPRAKTRIKLREAKKLERQSRYDPDKLGAKAVENQRRKKRDMMRIQEGKD